jgi:hypothetical protein
VKEGKKKVHESIQMKVSQSSRRGASIAKAKINKAGSTRKKQRNVMVFISLHTFILISSLLHILFYQHKLYLFTSQSGRAIEASPLCNA